MLLSEGSILDLNQSIARLAMIKLGGLGILESDKGLHKEKYSLYNKSSADIVSQLAHVVEQNMNLGTT